MIYEVQNNYEEEGHMAKVLDCNKRYFTILRGRPVIVEVMHVDMTLSANPSVPGEAVVRVTEVIAGNKGGCPMDVLQFTDWATFVDKLEPLAQEEFEIGQKVMTNFNNPMIVMGFEPTTNRVVCQSGTNPKEKERFSYKPHEIKEIIPAVEIRVGYQYLLNGTSQKVIVTRHPIFEDTIILITLNGDHPGRHVAILNRKEKHVLEKDLVAAGIHKISKV